MFEQHKQKLVAQKREELQKQLQEFEESLTPDTMRPQMQARFNEVTSSIDAMKAAHSNAVDQLKREQDEEISPLFREQEELRQALEVSTEEAPVA